MQRGANDNRDLYFTPSLIDTSIEKAIQDGCARRLCRLREDGGAVTMLGLPQGRLLLAVVSKKPLEKPQA